MLTTTHLHGFNVGGWQFRHEDFFATDALGDDSTGETYVEAGAYYHNPPGIETLIPADQGTIIGNMTLAGGLAALFDGNYAQGSGARAQASGSIGLGGKDWGDGTPRKVSAVHVWRPTDSGYNNTAGSDNNDFLVHGSATGAFGGEEVLLGDELDVTDYDGTRGSGGAAPASGYQYVRIPCDDTEAYRYHRVTLDVSPSNEPRIAEIELYAPPLSPDITLLTALLPTPGPAAQVTVDMIHRAIDATDMGTDCVVEISRDGISWAAVTMVSQGAWASDGDYTEWRGVGVPSGSGSAIRLRIRALNGIHQRVRGIRLLAEG